MLLTEFLAQYVEGYLLADLETMKAAGPADPAVPGHLGYAMLMTSAAGIELLGALSSVETFRAGIGATYFNAYWKNYLYPTAPDRGRVGDAVYQLARHGIAHNFAAKAPFIVGKGSGLHLVRDGSQTHIDAVVLASDLRESYVTRFKPIATAGASGSKGENATTMQERLRELISANAAKMTEPAKALAKLPAYAGESPEVVTPMSGGLGGGSSSGSRS